MKFNIAPNWIRKMISLESNVSVEAGSGPSVEAKGIGSVDLVGWIDAPTEAGWWWRYVSGSPEPLSCMYIGPVTIAVIRAEPHSWVRYSQTRPPALPNVSSDARR